MEYKIAVLPGDGIGPSDVEATFPDVIAPLKAEEEVLSPPEEQLLNLLFVADESRHFTGYGGRQTPPPALGHFLDVRG